MTIDKNIRKDIRDAYNDGMENTYEDTRDGSIECVRDIANRFDVTERQVEKILGW